MRLFRYTILAVLAMGLLAACGSQDEPAPPAVTDTPVPVAAAPEPVEISVVMNDIYFGEEATNQENPPVWTVPAGAEVTVNLDNQGNLQHNWAVAKLGAELPDVITDETAVADQLLFNAGVMDAGTSQAVSFTAPEEAGEYLVICTVAGHYPLMQGRLVVE